MNRKAANKKTVKRKTRRAKSTPKRTVVNVEAQSEKANITDQDQIKFLKKQNRDQNLVLEELIKINSDQALELAKQRATVRLFQEQQSRQAGGN